MSESMREQFEKFQVETGRTDPIWFDRTCFDEASGDYFLNEINSDWRQWEAAWKASRESLVIELPDSAKRDPFDLNENYYAGHLLGEMKDAIKAAGVKMK